MDTSIEKKLELVIKSAHTILESINFADAARIIFDHCRELTGAIAGYVALLNENGDENEVLFLEAGGLPCTVDQQLPMPVRGLRGVAYKTGKAVYENNFLNSKWIKFMPEGHVDLKNVMFAPLNLDGKTVGIMGLANKSGDFTDEDASIASVLGDLAAVALRNARYLDLLNQKNKFLEKALAEIKTLRGFLPICMHCKQIRNDEGFWQKVELYVEEHSEAQFTHSICDSCMEKLYPNE